MYDERELEGMRSECAHYAHRRGHDDDGSRARQLVSYAWLALLVTSLTT